MALFHPDSIFGQIWEEIWENNKLGDKEPSEIQIEYEKFCRHFKINVPCWEPIGPYPIPELKSVHEIILAEGAQDPPSSIIKMEEVVTSPYMAAQEAPVFGPPPAPLKGPRPYSYDDLDLLHAKRRLLFV